MIRIWFDSNIYDKFAEAESARQQMDLLTKSSKVVVLANDKLKQELANAPFFGVPEWFDVQNLPIDTH